MNSTWQKCSSNILFRFYPNVHIIFFCAGISFVCYSVLYKDVFLFDKKQFLNISVEQRIARKQPGNKLILLYTHFFGKKWSDYADLGPYHHMTYMEGDATFKDCQVSSCLVTYDKRKLLQADAVGFHGRDMPEVLPAQRTTNQIWFYFVLENPMNVVMDSYGYAGVFNWTMTYSRDSEIYAPYGMYESLTENSQVFDSYDTTTKDKKVAWLVSNCFSTERNEYVEELQNFIDVTIYGQCGDSESCPAQRHSPICNTLLKSHKFYLAFENGNCPEYITEKYWENAIENNIVPVVMGGADYGTLAIPNSYIDVQDFDSPKGLAEYLLYLDRNDSAYKEYFSWRKLYQHVAPKWACTLCKQLHNESLFTSPKVYKNMALFWNSSKCRRLNLTNHPRKRAESGFDVE